MFARVKKSRIKLFLQPDLELSTIDVMKIEMKKCVVTLDFLWQQNSINFYYGFVTIQNCGYKFHNLSYFKG